MEAAISLYGVVDVGVLLFRRCSQASRNDLLQNRAKEYRAKIPAIGQNGC